MECGVNRIERPRGIVGIPPRSAFSDVDEGRAIAEVMRAARGNIHPTPVSFGGRIIGVVRAEDCHSDRVGFVKMPAQYRMAWSDLDSMIASLAGSAIPPKLSKIFGKQPTSAPTVNSWIDFWPIQGNPTGAVYTGVANTANQYNDLSRGACYLGGDVAPLTKYILNAWGSGGAGSCTYMLYDRVLDYQSNAYTAAASQNMTNVLTAQRYAAAGQPGLQMLWTVDTAHNATATNITVLTYVDNLGNSVLMPTTPTVSVIPSAGAPSTTAGSRIIAPATSGALPTWGPFLPLATGTTGARSIADYTTSAANTGTFCLALVYPLVYIQSSAGLGPSYMPQVFQIDSLPRLFDGAAVSVMYYSVSSSVITLNWGLDVGWG